MTNFQGREQNRGAAIQSTGGGDRRWTDPGISGALIALAVTREGVASPIGPRAGFRAMARKLGRYRIVRELGRYRMVSEALSHLVPWFVIPCGVISHRVKGHRYVCVVSLWAC